MLSQDPNDVLSDLYNDLQIRSLIQRQEISKIKANEHRQYHWHSTGSRSSWQKLLDDLCFLCDYRRAGVTTTSIAVEQKASRHVMWLAMNGGSIESTKRHLREIVQLAAGNDSETLKADQVEATLKATIARSCQRVHNYANRLRDALVKLESKISSRETNESANGRQIQHRGKYHPD